MSTDDQVGSFVLLATLFIIYWIPLVVAIIRKHPQALPIGLITLFTAWTGIGWVVALVWSCARYRTQIA